ncbi:hypothetical protein [Staphylococcus warneri]|uniref:hypothetical protein n=1 Tax=Staphylococcus warneri TaxID=1292 RepID=UPI00164360A8|nr:hypothetical protein [Staphylococcus warneri]HDM0816757.1 hypothetical protein [Staphylococcus aureus]
MAKNPTVKPGLPNPWSIGDQIATSLTCRKHTKHTCKTSPAETKNPKANLPNQQ